MTTTDYAVVFTTCKNKAEALTIAERLVADRDAACVNIIETVVSVYRWQGKIEKAIEALLIIKTRAVFTGRVEGTIRGLSSYDCPEVIVLPIAEGSNEYLAWIGEATGNVSHGRRRNNGESDPGT